MVKARFFVVPLLWSLVFCLSVVFAGYCAAASGEDRDAVLRLTQCQAPEGAVVHDVWLEASPLSISTVNMEADEYVRVVLVASAGTGYEWALTNAKMSCLEAVRAEVVPFPKDSRLAGGPVAYIFLYKASSTAAGADRLSFSLYRPWEGVNKSAANSELNVRYSSGGENKFRL